MKKIEKINKNQKKYRLSLNRTSSGRGLALNRIRSGSGFTIIELMVVVLIIAILASIVIVTLEKGKLKARDSQRKADLASIATSLENYRVDVKSYPKSLDEKFCDLNVTNCLIKAGSTDFNLYQPTMPTDPLNDGNYVYKFKSDGSQFKIIAKSEGIEKDLGCTEVSIKQKAGDYCDPIDSIYFQISSNSIAREWDINE